MATGAAAGAGSIWQVTLALVAVVVVILALAWLLKRLQAGTLKGGGPLSVVAALPLGPRERLLLVDVAGTQLLIGVTAQQITTLHSFDKPVVDPHARPGAEFATRLREALRPGAAQ